MTSTTATNNLSVDEPFLIGGHKFQSRLIVGTGKYNTYERMAESLQASGAQVVTVAVRRERLVDDEGRSLF